MDADLAGDGSGDLLQRGRGRTGLALGHGRHADVRALADRDVEWDGSQEVDTVLRGVAFTASTPKGLRHFATMGAYEAGHILDETEYRHTDAPEHGQGFGHIGECHFLRRRDEHRACQRHGLGQRQLRVRGSGRQVHDQVVELAPLDVAEELLDRATHQRPSPDHRLALAQEELDRDHLDAVGLDGRDLAFRAGDGRTLGPDHHGHVGAGDVGVEEPDRGTCPGQSHGQVDADRGLPHPALAGSDGDDVLDSGQRLGSGGRGPSDRRAPTELDLLGPDRSKGGLDSRLDLILERTGRRRQLDRERHLRPVEHEVFDHVSRDQIAPQLGLLDGRESLQDGGFGEFRHFGRGPRVAWLRYRPAHRYCISYGFARKWVLRVSGARPIG